MPFHQRVCWEVPAWESLLQEMPARDTPEPAEDTPCPSEDAAPIFPELSALTVPTGCWVPCRSGRVSSLHIYTLDNTWSSGPPKHVCRTIQNLSWKELCLFLTVAPLCTLGTYEIGQSSRGHALVPVPRTLCSFIQPNSPTPDSSPRWLKQRYQGVHRVRNIDESYQFPKHTLNPSLGPFKCRQEWHLQLNSVLSPFPTAVLCLTPFLYYMIVHMGFNPALGVKRILGFTHGWGLCLWQSAQRNRITEGLQLGVLSVGS